LEITVSNPTKEEIEDLALRLEIDYREHRYQNCQRAASMLRRLLPAPEAHAQLLADGIRQVSEQMVTIAKMATALETISKMQHDPDPWVCGDRFEVCREIATNALGCALPQLPSGGKS
jgi:hypothetical protein